MNDIKVATGLGWFSLALGAVQIVASRRVAHALGLQSPGVVQALGARGVAAGISVLAYPDNPNPLWARAAGGALDLAVLAGTLGGGNRKRQTAAIATVAIAGAALLDVMCAASLTRRQTQALRTARRTRVTKQVA